MSSIFSVESSLAALFTAFCIAFVIRRVKTNGFLSPLDYSIIYSAVVYGLSWIVVVSAVINGDLVQYAHIYAANSMRLYAHSAGAFMAVMGLILGWTLTLRIAGSRQIKAPLPGLFFWIRDMWIYVAAFWIMLIVSIASLLLYTMDYGGPFAALDYSRLIRANIFEGFIRSRFSFLAPFGDFAILSCYGFWGLLLSKRHTVEVMAGFVLSLVVSLYVLYLAQGRLNAVVFISILTLSLLYVRRVNASYLVLILLAAVPVAVYATFLISQIFAVKSAGSFSEFYSREVSFAFVAFFANLSNPDGLYRFFYDVVAFPAYLLPSSLTEGWLDDPSDVTTALIHGAPKGTQGITSGMPVDLITMGLIQMGFFGIVPYAMMYGAALAGLYRICLSIRTAGVQAALYAYVCVRFAGLGLFYSQPSTIVTGNLPIILTLMIAAMWLLFKPARNL